MAKRKYGDGSVFQRHGGRWEGRLVVGYKKNGYAKTKSVTVKTKAECEERLKQLREGAWQTEREDQVRYALWRLDGLPVSELLQAQDQTDTARVLRKPH